MCFTSILCVIHDLFRPFRAKASFFFIFFSFQIKNIAGSITHLFARNNTVRQYIAPSLVKTQCLIFPYEFG